MKHPFFQTPLAHKKFISTQEFRQLNPDCINPAQTLSRLVKKGVLQRICRGIYMVSTKDTKTAFEIVELIRPESYITMQSALWFHGFAPFAPDHVEALTTGRSVIFETTIGTIQFRSVSPDVISRADLSHPASDVSISVATPEQAICDLFQFRSDCKVRSRKELIRYLDGKLSMDIEMLEELNAKSLNEIAQASDSLKVKRLAKFLGQIHQQLTTAQ